MVLLRANMGQQRVKLYLRTYVRRNCIFCKHKPVRKNANMRHKRYLKLFTNTSWNLSYTSG